jgi:hypothetical protein
MNLSDKIMELMVPLTGKMMAQSALQLTCSKLGIEAADIDETNLKAISEQMGKGLALFVGKEKAQELSESIQKLA